MNRNTILISLVAAAALAGCKKEDHTIVAGPPGDDTNAAASAPVALPPSIASSKVYRCSDSSLLYVDWMSDGSAHVKKKKDEVGGTPVAAGSPDLKGDAKATSITFKGQSCKA